MTDFRHANRTLVGGGFARHQLIFKVNFDHLAHQTVRRTAHRRDLLQDGKAGFAGLQRTFKGINLPPNAPHASQNAFFVFG
jgi:hypothetical protein